MKKAQHKNSCMTEILLATMMENGHLQGVFELKDALRQCIPDKCCTGTKLTTPRAQSSTATFSSASPPGLKVRAGYDVDIETRPHASFSLLTTQWKAGLSIPYEAAIAMQCNDSGSAGRLP